MTVYTDPATLHVGEPVTCRVALSGQVISFDSEVRHLDKSGLFVERPAGIGEQLTAGIELLVRYVRPDSAYQFLTVVLPQQIEQQLETPPDLRDLPLHLRFPGRITRYQRRAYDRSQVEGIVKYRSAGQEIRTYRGYIVDLSAGGVRFATRQVGFLEEGINPVGMHILLSLLLSRGTEFNDIPSEIRRVSLDKEHVQDDYLIVQAAFRELDGKAQDKLDTWLKRTRRNRRQNA